MQNNKIENAKRTEYEYKVGEFAKIVHDVNTYMRPTKLSQPSEGPYEIVEIYANGTVKIQRGGYREILSITRIAPFFRKE